MVGSRRLAREGVCVCSVGLIDVQQLPLAGVTHVERNMAPASRAVVLVALSLLYLCRAIFSTEYFSTLTLFNNELHKQGCSSLSEWEEYAADCGKVSVFRC